jgi:hypothetical protein
VAGVRRRATAPPWLPLKTFVEYWISHPNGMPRAGEALGPGRLRATPRFRDWHRNKHIEVRVYDPTSPTWTRLIGPDDYEFLDAEMMALHRRGWERWAGVEVRGIPPADAVVVRLRRTPPLDSALQVFPRPAR